MKAEVYPDAEAAAQAGAKFIAAAAREAVTVRGQFVLAVSGGKGPWRMFRLLAGEPVPWHAVHIVQVDERVAPDGDADRNLTHLRESLFSHTSLSPDHIHAMPVEAENLAAGADDYSRQLQRIAGAPPVLDLVHVGLGPDGHTASLVPGDPVLTVTDRDVAITGVYQSRRRMTLTYPILNRARQILWLVGGADKVNMLQRLADGDQSIPAGRLFRDAAVVLADQAATGGKSQIKGKQFDERNIMRLGVATDHGGFELKQNLAVRLRAAGHEVVDFGAHQLTPDDDYPDFVIPLAQAVAAGKVERGIAVCGSGVGANVCANKVKGVRACLIEDHFSARQGVEDDNLNLLCLGGRIEGPELAWDLVQTYLQANFSQAPRHQRRLRKVSALENSQG